MMRRYMIRPSTHEAIKALAIYPWHETCRMVGGMREMLLDDETSARLEAIRFSGESDDDLVLRLIANYKGMQ